MKRAAAKCLLPLLAVAMAACTSVPVEPKSSTEPEQKSSTAASRAAGADAGETPDAAPQKSLPAVPVASPRPEPEPESERSAAAESAMIAPAASTERPAAGNMAADDPNSVRSANGTAQDAAESPAKSVDALERQLDAELSAFDAAVAESLEDPSDREEPVSSSSGAGGSAGSSVPAANAANRDRGSGDRAGAPYVGEKPPPPGLRRPSWAEDADTAAGDSAPAAGQGMQPTASEDFYADDDVVARQLREAAERETDPELADKLWQEYRNYKEVVQ